MRRVHRYKTMRDAFLTGVLDGVIACATGTGIILLLYAAHALLHE